MRLSWNRWPPATPATGAVPGALTPEWASAQLKGLLKTTSQALGLRVSEFLALGWDSSIYISNTFPGESDTDAAGPGTTL